MANPSMDVQYVAHLARLELTPDEQARFGAQLGEVLAYFEQLKQVDVAGIEPLAHAMPLVNVTRSDRVRGSLAHAEALGNAPAPANGLFVVPKIVE
jgi:aspartyl-tRNA(Asn)/glutamyl-tRNA(Gln) amidotransferase subunit C